MFMRQIWYFVMNVTESSFLAEWNKKSTDHKVISNESVITEEQTDFESFELLKFMF